VRVAAHRSVSLYRHALPPRHSSSREHASPFAVPLHPVPRIAYASNNPTPKPPLPDRIKAILARNTRAFADCGRTGRQIDIALRPAVGLRSASLGGVCLIVSLPFVIRGLWRAKKRRNLQKSRRFAAGESAATAIDAKSTDEVATRVRQMRCPCGQEYPSGSSEAEGDRTVSYNGRTLLVRVLARPASSVVPCSSPWALTLPNVLDPSSQIALLPP
jgi:hypothetical protein